MTDSAGTPQPSAHLDPDPLSVRINADAQQIWVMLREPSLLAQWHGWNYGDGGLAEEIQQIYFTDATEQEDHLGLTLGSGDLFILEPVGDGTRVSIRRAPVAEDSDWAQFDADITEGWISFLHQLRFALERHPHGARQTTFLSGATGTSGSILDRLGLADLPDIGAPYRVMAATGEELSGKVWYRTERQLGLTVSRYADHGDGLLIVADQPPAEGRPDGGTMVIVSSYGLGAHDLAQLRGRWDTWRAENLPGSEPVV
jgi:hypothetical protein